MQTTHYRLTCDCAPDCTQSLEYDNLFTLHDLAREQGWLRHGGKDYAPGHRPGTDNTSP